MVALIPGYVASPTVRKAQKRVRNSDSTWGRQRCRSQGHFLTLTLLSVAHVKVWLLGIALPVKGKEAGEKEHTNLALVCSFYSLGECLSGDGAGVGAQVSQQSGCCLALHGPSLGSKVSMC